MSKVFWVGKKNHSGGRELTSDCPCFWWPWQPEEYWSGICSVVSKFYGNASDVFFMVDWCCGFWEDITELWCHAHHTPSSAPPVNVTCPCRCWHWSPSGWGLFVSFLLHKVTLLLTFRIVLFGRKSLCSPHLKSGELCPSSRGQSIYIKFEIPLCYQGCHPRITPLPLPRIETNYS